jgi:membrane protein YdbS with pleckstrin-like domain
MARPITIRKNPIVIVRNLILLEIAGYAAFLVAAALADYGEIYNQLPLARLVSYRLAEVTGITVAEMLMTAAIFAAWFYTYLELRSDSLLYARGLLLRRKTVIPLDRIEAVSYEYGILGKMFHYGTLVIRTAVSGRDIRFPHAMTPREHAALIIKLKRRGAAAAFAPLDRTVIEDVETLLTRAEDERLEFKATLRWDLRASRVNRQLERAVLKSVAAFLNSGGGYVVVGVSDGREVVGLEHDCRTIQFPGVDGFENHFTLVFNGSIGAAFRPLVRLHFRKLREKDICLVEVNPSPRPAYVRFDGAEEFYVRTGNTTTSLSLSEAAAYLDLWRRRT